MSIKSIGFPLTLALLLTVAGCSVSPSQPGGPPVVDKGIPPTDSAEPGVIGSTVPPVETPIPATPMPQTPAPIIKQSSAVVALLDQAQTAREQGNYRSAQGSLQRAQRIAPKDPDVYYALALTHMEMEDYALAEQVALKGVSVSQGDNRQLKRMWLLTAKIRMRAGNVSGAQQAESRASRY